jgi:hypothetical protein
MEEKDRELPPRRNRIWSVVLEPTIGAEPEVSVAVGTGKQFDLPDPRRIRIAIDHVLRLATRFGRLPLACERMDENGRTLRCIRAIGEAPIAIPRELDGTRSARVSEAPKLRHE